MPDETRIAEPASTTDADPPRPRERRLGRNLRYGIVMLVALAAIVAAGRWGYWQWSHISEADARVTTDTVAISSRVAGWIVALEVGDGSKVDRGELLIEIDSRESQLKLTEYGARLAALAAEQEQIRSEIELIDLTSASRIEAFSSRADAARVAVTASREQLDLARAEFERARALLAEQVVSRQRLDRVRSDLSRAEERHQRARADLAAALADISEAEAERGEMTVLARRIDALGHAAAEIAAQRDQQALDVADRTIESPINGVVSQTFVDVGEFVSPGQRLMLVHDPGAVWVEANIKETDIRHVAPGMAAEVTIDAYPDRTFAGTVARIGAAATSEFALLPNPNPSGNFTKVTQRLPVRIALDPGDAELRPGMMAVVNISIPGR